MKNFILFLLFSLFVAIPIQASKTINVNPINLAVLIVEKTDTTKIKMEFDYYGYRLQNIEDDYYIMKSPKGNEIRYTFKDSISSGNFPTVIVKTHGTHKEIEAWLKELKFEKEGNTYRRLTNRNDDHIVQCAYGSSKTLVFKCIKR